jgi:hypothetical protein
MWITLGAVALVTAVGAGLAFYAMKPRSIPDRVESIGPLELVTQTTSYFRGWNQGRMGWETTEHYFIRYRGKPVTFEGRDGMYGDKTRTYSTFNAIVSFPSKEPAVVVNVGDPNNTSFFYLIREDEKGLRVQHLIDIPAGVVSATMLDAPPGDKSAINDIAVHRSRLTGGRFLLLGLDFVLDTETFDPYKIEPDYDKRPNEFAPPLSMSPDKHSFVRFGYTNNNSPILVDVDFVEGKTYALPIVRSSMRYNGWEELTSDWLNHHCDWKPGPTGHQRLTERLHYKPLPYRGTRRVETNDPRYHEYNLVRVKPEMFEKLNAFIEAEFHATRSNKTVEASMELAIDGVTVNTIVHDFHVGLFNNRGQDPKLVDQIGDRFDALLKTGALDDLFLPLN